MQEDSAAYLPKMSRLTQLRGLYRVASSHLTPFCLPLDLAYHYQPKTCRLRAAAASATAASAASRAKRRKAAAASLASAATAAKKARLASKPPRRFSKRWYKERAAEGAKERRLRLKAKAKEARRLVAHEARHDDVHVCGHCGVVGCDDVTCSLEDFQSTVMQTSGTPTTSARAKDILLAAYSASLM